VPAAWLRAQLLGEATLVGEYAFIGHSQSLAFVRSTLGDRLAQYRLADLDAATIRLSTPRRFTQEVSRLIYETPTLSGGRFGGIRYGSRLGDELDNWAIFESVPGPLRGGAAQPVDPGDPDLRGALDLLGLEIA
jgi:hypothetical protein